MGAAGPVGIWRYLAERERVGLDTSIFIYYFNRQQPYFPICRDLLKRIEVGTLRGVISVVTEMEMLAAPEIQNRLQAINDVEQLLGRLTHLEVLSVDRTIARRAAALRVQSRIKGIDALVAATALTRGCRLLIGNDREFEKRVTDISYLALDDFV